MKLPPLRRLAVAVGALIAAFAAGAVTIALIVQQPSEGAAETDTTTIVVPPSSDASTSTSTSPAPTSTVPRSEAAPTPSTDATEPAETASAPLDVGPVQFVADFASPDDLGQFDWQVFHGGVDPFPRSDQPREWQGDHDDHCGAPTSLRNVELVGEVDPSGPEAVGDLVWWCGSRPDAPASSGHVMTSISSVAYAHIDFSPREVVNDVSRVCWDQNWTEMGGRKWTQVVVVSDDTFQANDGRMEYVNLSLQDDVAVNGIALDGDTWMLTMLRASTRVQVGQDETHVNDGGFTTDDRSRRFRHCAVDQGDGTVLLELERPDGVETRIAPGSFPSGPVRVIFQDATYDSVKGDLPFDEALETNTWHWDNIEIS